MPITRYDSVIKKHDGNKNMNRYSRDYELKDKAKDTLGGNYGTLILGSFLFWLVICLVILGFGTACFFFAAMSRYLGGGYSIVALRIFQAGLLLGAILAGFLRFGVSYMCLKLACGASAGYTDIFYGLYGVNMLKTLFLTVLRLLLIWLCALPGEYFRAAYIQSPGIPALVMALLAYGAGCAAYIPGALALDMAYFVQLDFPGKKAAEITRSSFRLIKGSRLRLFFLQLKFIPLQLLSLLTFGVGSLWLEPYMHMTYTMFYLDLINPQRQ